MTKPHYRMTADGQVLPAIRANDGLQNLVSGMGTDKDKAAFNVYAFDALTDAELEAAYSTSALAQRIVDIPAEDAGREWREWQAEVDQISKIEAEEKRLGVQRKLIEAMKIGRMRGGAVILIGTGDSDTTKPLDPRRIGKGGLKYLTVIPRSEITAGEIERDPREPGYGKPKVYRIAGEVALDIHPSRVVHINGKTVPGGSLVRQDGWGESVLNATLGSVKRMEGGANNVESLLFEAKTDVVRIDGLTEQLSAKGASYEALLLRRFALANKGKGINSMLLLDGKEQWDQKTASFGSLPDVLDRFAQLVSAAAGIPMTLLFGMSPGGLNSTGDSDIRAYYDRVKVLQSLEIEPELTVLDECLIRSALGDRPADVFYNWRSLWQTTAKERAEVGDKLASVAERLHRIEAAPHEALADAIVNAMTELGVLPGLEGAVKDYFAGGSDPEPADMADAAPRTLYVKRRVTNAAEIIEWAKGQGFKTTLPADDLHVTIAYSRAAVDWMKVGQAWQSEIEIPEGGPRMMEAFGEARDAKVLLFASGELTWRHEAIKEAGATWDHPQYQPHITISYDPEAPDIEDVEPYQGRIVLGPEVFAEVDEGWKEKVSEK